MGTEEPPGRCFLRVVARHGAAMARHGRRPSPAPVPRPAGFSPATGHATWFSPALRRLHGEQPQARPTGFHETRKTAFFTVHAQGTHSQKPPSGPPRTPPGRCFPERCGAAWGGYGAAWAAAVPRAGNTACWVFTSHGTRNMVFPLPSGDFMESNLKPDQRVFHETRDTNHETRLFFESRLPYPRFPTISRPPHPPPLFSLGFPARAVSRSSRRPPGSFLCG